MEIFQRMFIITNLRCILKKLLFYINNIFYQAERGKAYGISLILNSKNTIHMPNYMTTSKILFYIIFCKIS